MRIFLGTEDVASILYEIGKGLKKNGHQVTTYVRQKNKYYSHHNYSIIRDTFFDDYFKYSNWAFLPQRFKSYIKLIDSKISKPWLWFKNKNIVNNNDVFVFIWRPWLPEEKLFPYLKKKNKKIICLHVGSDVRHYSAFEQEYKTDTSNWEAVFHNTDANELMQKIRWHELFADDIYSVPDQAGLMIKPYNHLFIPLSQTKNIEFKLPDNDIPLIIHAPSRTGIKGTDIIIDVINKLKQEGNIFDFRLIQNMPNEELTKLLTQADILCDELYLNGPGVLSAEAMAAGCVVLTKCLNIPPFTPPIVSVTKDTLYNSLKQVINDKQFRINIAQQAKEYVSQQNNASNIANTIINNLVNTTKKYDYYPTFFLQSYQFQNKKPITKKTKKLNATVINQLQLQQFNLSLTQRNLI